MGNASLLLLAPVEVGAYTIAQQTAVGPDRRCRARIWKDSSFYPRRDRQKRRWRESLPVSRQGVLTDKARGRLLI